MLFCRVIDTAASQLTKTAITVTAIFIVALGYDGWYYFLGYSGATEYKLNSPVQILGEYYELIFLFHVFFSLKMLPQWALNLDRSHSSLMLFSLSHWGMCYLGDLRSAYGHALLVLAKLSRSVSKIEAVQRQK